MRTTTLHGTSLTPSILGFGGVTLTLHPRRSQALEILETALDQGITYYDTARIYGFGQAEGILGEFLQGKRDRVIVTSKFGRQPKEALAKHRALIGVARKVLNTMPAVKRLVSRSTHSLTATTAAFDPKDAVTSLDKSLGELRTDHIDIFLMHEGTLADSQRDGVREFLEREVAKGRIRHFGVSNDDAWRLGDDLRSYHESFKVFHFTDNTSLHARSKLAAADERAIITFGCEQIIEPLTQFARANPEVARRYSQQVGRDLSDPVVIAALSVQDSLAANRGGVVLVGPLRIDELKKDIEAANAPPPSSEQLAAFAAFTREATAAQTK